MALQNTPLRQLSPTTGPSSVEERRPIPYRNLAVGAFMNVFQGESREIRNIPVGNPLVNLT